MFEEIAFTQEWRVFKVLCPEKLMNILKNAYKFEANRNKLTDMFDCLGFQELSFYFFTEFSKAVFDERQSIRVVKNEEIKYSADELVQMFIDNIDSLSLKDLFVKKADYMCTSDGYV